MRFFNPDKGFNATKPFVEITSIGAAAAISRTLVAPFDRAKLLLQVQNVVTNIPTDKRYVGMVNIFIRVPKENGFLALWRGNSANVLRYAPTQFLNFAFKDMYKDQFIRGVDMKRRFWKFLTGNLLSGGLAGVTSLFFVYPLDFARTLLTVKTSKIGPNEFRGVSDCLVKIARSEGITGLYRGFFAAIPGIFFYRAIYFGLYDTTTSLLTTSEEEKLGFIANYIIALAITLPACLFVYPYDTISRRSEILYENTKDCFIKIIRNENVSALFKGAFVNILRSAGGGALFLALYDEIPEYQ
ncbi:ADP/ATP translocase [Aphelenchoides bicaudatus]|nr:ADP/ATP translocase [Aphelenchoides bicaudatus]